MEITITKKDLEEIERNYDGLAGWLTSHFTNISTCAFVFTTLMDAVDKAKEQLNDN